MGGRPSGHARQDGRVDGGRRDDLDRGTECVIAVSLQKRSGGVVMRLPNADQAMVDLGKLREYCLNPLHPEGRHKARVFRAALDIGPEDAEWLRQAIIAAIQKADIIRAELTPFGWRYDVDVELIHKDRSTGVRTGWIVRQAEGIPRLATCFVR